MADVSALTVQGRDRAGKGAARATRRHGLVPGVIYGDKQDPVLIAMEPRDLTVAMHKPGFATQIFEITVGKDTHRAMAQDIQIDPVRDVPIRENRAGASGCMPLLRLLASSPMDSVYWWQPSNEVP